jgi:hypothetical protein
MSKILNHKQNCFGHWKFKFGIYLGFEIPSLSTYLATDISFKKINKGSR